jgi:hypothetical protein
METHKQLAQSDPVINTNTTVYTVPALTTTLLYSAVVANVGAGAGKFRIFIVPSAGAAAPGNAIYFDVNVPKEDTFVANISVILETGGFIVVFSDSGDHTFTLSGMEIT